MVIDVAIATLAVLLIASPLLFTSDGDTGLCADKTPGSEFEPSIAH